tara:strand:+ start:329 stop:826 length:498 start_codon:yes stop_codon:yes gene_type:complete
MTTTSRNTVDPTIVKQERAVAITEELYEKQRSAIDSLFAQSKARLRLYKSEIRANDALQDRCSELQARCDALFSTAAQATLRGDKAVNRLNRAESDLESSRSAHRDCRDALKTALVASLAPLCKECDGTGDGFRFVSGGPSDEDQPEMVDKGGCEDCDGLGLEWL